MWSTFPNNKLLGVLPDQLIGTHITIADKQHIAPDIKVKVKFQVKAHQTLYTTY